MSPEQSQPIYGASVGVIVGISTVGAVVAVGSMVAVGTSVGTAGAAAVVCNIVAVGMSISGVLVDRETALCVGIEFDAFLGKTELNAPHIVQHPQTTSRPLTTMMALLPEPELQKLLSCFM